VGRFIVDFYCHEAKLAIELDGGGHAEQNQADYDWERTLELKSEGIRVLRIWDNDVFENLEGVLEVILDALTPTLSQREREQEGFCQRERVGRFISEGEGTIQRHS
jgi:very-short-patch-repair endonuclease